jgi:hypothetical protein
MSNTADVTGGKPIAVWSQSILGVNAINPLVAFYDIYGRKREVVFFYSQYQTDMSSQTPHETNTIKIIVIKFIKYNIF